MTEAVVNDVALRPNYRVDEIRNEGDFNLLNPGENQLRARIIINAGGLDSARIDGLFGYERFSITPRRGELIVFDKEARKLLNSIILPVPTSGMDTLPTPKNPGAQKNELALESADAMIQFRPETVVDRISPRAAMWI